MTAVTTAVFPNVRNTKIEMTKKDTKRILAKCLNDGIENPLLNNSNIR